MKRTGKWRRRGMTFFGLACLLLFMGTKQEGCSSCGFLEDDRLEERGFIRIINFLDLYEYVCVEVWGLRCNTDFARSDTGFGHKWESPRDNPVYQEPTLAGTYDYWWKTERGHKTRSGKGVLIVEPGGTTILHIQ